MMKIEGAIAFVPGKTCFRDLMVIDEHGSARFKKICEPNVPACVLEREWKQTVALDHALSNPRDTVETAALQSENRLIESRPAADVRARSLPRGVMVALQILDLSVGVRVPAG